MPTEPIGSSQGAGRATFGERIGGTSTPEEAARFAQALRAQMRAAQAEALGIALSDGRDRGGSNGGSALAGLIDGLQRTLLGLPPGDSSLAGMLAGYRGLGDGGRRIAGFPYERSLADDPHGWREMARAIGDGVVGEGFGVIFERQIDQESGFRPEVALGRELSSAGAEGIAQLMPSVYPNVDRLDPLESLTVAAGTMADYLARFDGDGRMALAAYNAGPARVSQLVAAHGANWEQGLPAETRLYLQRILGPARPRLVFEAAALRTPVSGALTQGYSAGGHQALDIGASAGTPIRAAAAGRVVSVERLDTGYGWNVIIEHGDGMRSLYAHASAIYARPGDTVRRGEVIGAVGNTGTSSGPHLHFELRRDGVAVDPRPYLA